MTFIAFCVCTLIQGLSPCLPAAKDTPYSATPSCFNISHTTHDLYSTALPLNASTRLCACVGSVQTNISSELMEFAGLRVTLRVWNAFCACIYCLMSRTCLSYDRACLTYFELAVDWARRHAPHSFRSRKKIVNKQEGAICHGVIIHVTGQRRDDIRSSG